LKLVGGITAISGLLAGFSWWSIVATTIFNPGDNAGENREFWRRTGIASTFVFVIGMAILVGVDVLL